MATVSARVDPRIWPRLAPTARNRADSRPALGHQDRERVVDAERGHHEGDAGEHGEDVVKALRNALPMSSWSSELKLATGMVWVDLGNCGFDPLTRAVCDMPGSPLTRIWEISPCRLRMCF